MTTHIATYLELFKPLSLQEKLTVLAALTEELRASTSVESDNISARNELFETTSGAWSDIDIDVEQVIYESRSASTRDLNFD